MGLFNAYGKAFDERERNVERFNKRYNEGELTLPQLTIHNLGQAMGSITDIGFVTIAADATGLFGLFPADVPHDPTDYLTETPLH